MGEGRPQGQWTQGAWWGGGQATALKNHSQLPTPPPKVSPFLAEKSSIWRCGSEPGCGGGEMGKGLPEASWPPPRVFLGLPHRAPVGP